MIRDILLAGSFVISAVLACELGETNKRIADLSVGTSDLAFVYMTDVQGLFTHVDRIESDLKALHSQVDTAGDDNNVLHGEVNGLTKDLGDFNIQTVKDKRDLFTRVDRLERIAVDLAEHDMRACTR